jgi:hypothetical protein
VHMPPSAFAEMSTAMPPTCPTAGRPVSLHGKRSIRPRRDVHRNEPHPTPLLHSLQHTWTVEWTAPSIYKYKIIYIDGDGPGGRPRPFHRSIHRLNTSHYQSSTFHVTNVWPLDAGPSLARVGPRARARLPARPAAGTWHLTTLTTSAWAGLSRSGGTECTCATAKRAVSDLPWGEGGAERGWV